ncbi:MAG: VWA domain-containing protein [Planctomycetota bacterium]
MRLFWRFFFLLTLIAPLDSQMIATSSQRIRLTLLQLDSQHYPEIQLHLKLEPTTSGTLLSWTPRQISLFEDGLSVPAQVQTFYQPKRVSILVLDTSASMNALLPDHQKTRIQAAKEAALTFYGLMEQGDRSALMTFSDQVQIRQLMTSRPESLQKALESISPQGATALYQALANAIQELQGIAGNKIVLILTDGKNTEEAPALETLIQFAKKQQIRIFLVGLASEQELEWPLLKRIAIETGGQAYQTLNKEQLEAIYSSIARSFKQEYLLSYRSTLPASGHIRNLHMVFQNGNQLFSGDLPLVFGGLVPRSDRPSVDLVQKFQEPHLIFFHYSLFLMLSALIPWILRKGYRRFRQIRFENRYLLRMRESDPAMGQVCANEQNEDTVFRVGDEVITCPECHALHHRDCWAYNGFRCFNSPPCRGSGGG